MKYLRKAAARERRAPILWWFLMIATMTGMLCLLIWQHSHDFSIFLGFLLAGIWFAPLVAFLSLSAPRRARAPVPEPGAGSYRDWIKQARLLGRLLLYYADNPELSDEVKQSIRLAREDLRDTLKAHPLSDDLERVCGRIRSGALQKVKAGFWDEHRRHIEELAHEVESSIHASDDEDEQLLIQHSVVEDAAALMARHCMPRMLERERLACAIDCSWLAAQTAVAHREQVSPAELAARLVIEWSDFSEPWQPARVLRRVLGAVGVKPTLPMPVSVVPVSDSVPAPLAPELSADESLADSPSATISTPPAKAGEESPPSLPPKRRKVRVRVRRDHRRYRQKKCGPSIQDILLSFGQWIRYSIRSWMLYR